MRYTIAVVGATGLVGRQIIKVLEELNLPVEQLIPVASSRSAGKKVLFRGREVSVKKVTEALKAKPHIAIFSAGAGLSKDYAQKFAAAGITVIDNSSAWRNEQDIPLVVPEINARMLNKEHKIIANPNCSTIQMVVALYPLHRAFQLKRVWISTYQSVSGSGMKGIEQMNNEREGKHTSAAAYPYQIDLNVIPQGGAFDENGYSEEEMKLVHETRKILSISDLKVTATVARVPVKGGHSEAITAEFGKDFDIRNVRDILSLHRGIQLQDNPYNNLYPMPLFAEGKDDVFVGRLRKDLFSKNTLNMWVVTDNLRKGAATNAVQIAQYLIANKLV
ncbi:MAG: aspartate-semialdehyde dehydrogenase [Bacteroidales bacterium]|nr:aspartate-semialdehyde dehydrogenase [Bacteroidales bacterium]